MSRASAVLAVVVVLSGCSSLQFAYSFADDVLEGRADDYLDLSEEQEVELGQQTEALISWHRATMLPKYAAFFEAEADTAAQGTWTREGLAQSFATFRTLIDNTIEGASPFMAAVLVQHSAPDKLAYFEARMDENLAERREDEAAETPEESVEEWVERRTDRIERFTGPLTAEQVAIIRRFSENGMDNGMRWLDHREKRQDALVDFMQSRPTEQELSDFVYRIMIRAHEVVDPDYKAVSDKRWALREDMYFEILTSLSEDQRDRLVSNLRSYADDMVSLAGV